MEDLKKERLKLIVRNMKLLLDSLESEVFSDVDAYKYESYNSQLPLSDYDEVIDDDDGYPD